MSNNDSDITSYSTISPISSETPGLNAQEILEQKFLKIGTTVYFDFDKSTLNSEKKKYITLNFNFYLLKNNIILNHLSKILI